jgi:hypothetical protein
VKPWKFLKMRKAWKKAQRVHILEHEANQRTTMSCDAVGHLYKDYYEEMFDHEYQRKFMREYRPMDI